MIKKLWNTFKKPKKIAESAPKREKPRQVFSTNDLFDPSYTLDKLDAIAQKTFQHSIHPELKIALDAAAADKTANFSYAMDNMTNIKSAFFGNELIPNGQLLWYANQGFIGYQLCAMLAQQWLISKSCLMPAEDATRKGYEITVNDGSEVEPDVLDKMRKLDNDLEPIISHLDMSSSVCLRLGSHMEVATAK